MDESAPPDSPGLSGPPGTRKTKVDPSPWQLAGLGMQFLLVLLGGVAGGGWVDRRFGSAPWGILGGVLFAGAVFVRLVRPYLRDDPAPRPPSPPAPPSS